MEKAGHNLLENSMSYYIQSPQNNVWYKALAIVGISDILSWTEFQGHFMKNISNFLSQCSSKWGLQIFCQSVFVTSLQ